MPEMTLHFEAAEGTDTSAAAAALAKELQQVSGVEEVHASEQHFQAIGPSEVLTILNIATPIVTSSAAFLTAVAGLLAAWEKVKAQFPGLKAPTAEVGLKQVPATQLTEAHREEIFE